jgi:hypothetical protein
VEGEKQVVEWMIELLLPALLFEMQGAAEIASFGLFKLN